MATRNQTYRKTNRKPKSSCARERRLAHKQANASNFQMLEDRRLLASVTVGNATDVLSSTANTSSIATLMANDGGDGISLREAITAANNTAGADTITFDPSVFTGGSSSLIRLTMGELEITDSLDIDASSATEVIITGDSMGNDTVLAGTFITDVAASMTANALSDNTRVLNFSSSSGDLTLTELAITGGRTGSTQPGGGIRFDSNDTLNLTSSSISGNSTGTGRFGGGNGGDGGGIFTLAGMVTLTNSTVSGNSTGDGGDGADADPFGSYAEDGGNGGNGGGIRTGSGMITLINSTVSGNSTGAGGDGGDDLYGGLDGLDGSGGYGGGIHTVSGSVFLANSTVTGNDASAAGGGVSVRNSSSNPSVVIVNSIIAGNADDGTSPDLRPDPGSALAVNHSLIGDTSGSGIDGSTGSGNLLNVVPLLGPLADNGGPTQTHALLQGSPALDAGDASLLPGGVTFDQRGAPFLRDDGNGIDIGAFEAVQEARSLVVTTSDDVLNIEDQLTSLREAISYANELSTDDTITFASALSGQAITLGGAELEITDAVTIDATALAANVTIDANELSRIFNITATTGDFQFNGLTLTGGRTTGSDSFFSNNHKGGAIRSLTTGNLTLHQSTVAGNSTVGGSADGGGVFASGNVAITGSTVSGNSTAGNFADGGGVFSRENIVITGSTVSGNIAGGFASRGGGVSAFGDVTLSVSTVTNNEATSTGGGILNSGDTILIDGSIVAGNTGGSGMSDIDSEAATFSVNFSLIGLEVTPDAATSGNNVVTNNPMLAALADNGGPTQTHALLAGSPAIDRGDPAIASPSAFDQRGAPFVRVSGGRIDIGAFELQPLFAPIVTGVVRDGGGVLARPDLLSTFVVTFDQDVNVGAGDLVVRNDTLGGVLIDTSSIGFSYSPVTRTATWDFSGLPDLEAAFYSFDVSDTITGVVGGLALDGDNDGTAGDNYVESIYVAIPGDANQDGQVDVLGDAFLLVGNLGTTGGATWAQGDFNDDGNVNVLGDAFVLVGNLGQDVRPLATAATSITNYLRIATPLFVGLDEGDKQDVSNNYNGSTLSLSEQQQLVLAGDHELRDDVFGSDF